MRLNASMYNLIDGYPPFGLNVEFEPVKLEVEYPEEVSRVSMLVRTLFGALYVMLPHGFILGFRQIWGAILQMLAWWIVLFTGNYPESWHEFQEGTFRWSLRVNLYMKYMSDEYPPFSGK